MEQSFFTLSNGIKMPSIGLGVYKSANGEEINTAISSALSAGYRLIDTAMIYQNEEGVGQAIAQSNVPREEIFLTSKVWNTDQGYQSTKEAFHASLKRLNTEYLDLYLIHWPKGELSVETWRAMEELYDEGKIKAIGVSNFLIHQLEDLLANCRIKPMVNQYEFHPELQQPELRAFCLEHGIRPQAWTPILRGKVMQMPLLQELGEKYGKSPVQITLRWDIQKGIATIPKSVTPARIKSNMDIFDFELTEAELAQIDALDLNKRMGSDPDNFDF